MNKLLLATLLAGLFMACKNQVVKSPAMPETPLQSEMKTFQKRWCLQDSTCAEMLFSYPVFSGGNAQATAILNDSIAKNVTAFASWDTVYTLPLPQALETAANRFFSLFQEAAGEGMAMGWANELNTRILLQNKQYVTLEYTGISYTGGAHGMTLTELVTYNLNTGQPVRLQDMLKDTVLVLNLLEQAFRKEKEIPNGEATKDYLLVERFPLPYSAGIVPEGIRFFYNQYEIAAYALGPTDVLLSWEQLGAAADRKKWIE